MTGPHAGPDPIDLEPAASGAETVDALLPERALVIGSLPPGGRDLDLLVRPAAAAALERGLSEAAFEHHRGVFARFSDCTAEVVDLIPAAEWGLPAEEVSALFDEALPVEGYERLVRPAPAHVLLILARRLAGDLRGRLDAKRRARLEAALAEDPRAWEAAAARAGAWGASAALERLRAASGRGTGAAARRRPGRSSGAAVRRRLTGGGRSALRRLPRPRRGAVVTFSGLDGSGKSSQAEALRDALQALGYDAEVVWTSLVAHPALGAVGEPVKRLLGSLRRESTSAQPEEGSPEQPAPAPDAARALREQSPLLTQAWSIYVALVNAWWQSRATRPLMLRGKVVICDRWTLDSKVQMRYQYGSERRFALQARLVRALSPRPLRSYLLDISAEEAVRRKPEYTVEQNALRARLYLEDHEALDVACLDGERPREELCAQIAAEVWRALRS